MVVTLVGERFSNGELVGVYAVLSIAWGVGALIGPMMGGSHGGEYPRPTVDGRVALRFVYVVYT